MTVVVLDSGPLGLLCNPRNPPRAAACRQWLSDLRTAGRRVVLPEVADYEVRRELIRRRAIRALHNLDRLGFQLEYLPITTAAMRQAADFWAQARAGGRPTAPDAALDNDVILAAQARSLGVSVIVATTNAAHLSRYVAAADWTAIPV